MFTMQSVLSNMISDDDDDDDNNNVLSHLLLSDNNRALQILLSKHIQAALVLQTSELHSYH